MNAKDFLARYGRAEAKSVAALAGTNYRYFYQLATGKRRASVDLAQRLVEASGGRMDQMMILTALTDKNRHETAPDRH